MGSIEAVVLTGGESRRMGFDKASIAIDGVPQADRIVRQFLAAGLPVTVLGRQPINGAAFLPDEEMFGGPIAALARFVPSAEFVFVSSCDLPRFDVRLISFLASRIGDAQACTANVDGFRQPLCALYASDAFSKLADLEDQCAMGWLNALNTVVVPEQDLVNAGLDPRICRGANTPEELAEALSEVRA